VRTVVHLASRDLRRHWAAWLAFAVILGLVGGLVMSAAAAARRTRTAFPRLFEATNAFDVLVNPNDGAMDFDTVEQLPEVTGHSRVAGLGVLSYDEQGQPQFGTFAVFGGLDPRFALDIDQPKVTAGRLPRLDATDEAFASVDVARAQRLDVGDTVRALNLTMDELLAAEGGARDVGTPVELKIVGIGWTADDLLTAPDERLPLVYVPYGYVRRYDPAVLFTASVLDLAPSTDASVFVAKAQAVDHERLVFYQTKASLLSKASSVVGPDADALVAFAAAAGIAAALIVGQALARQVSLDASDDATLRALGVSRRELFLSAVARGAVLAVAATVLAVLLAIVLSPLGPVGRARAAELDPGVSFDGLVLTLGVVAVLVFPVAVVGVSAWRIGRRSTSRAQRNAPAHPSAIVDQAIRAGVPLPAAIGVRMALEPGKGPTAVPARSTIVGAVLSVAVIATALTFGASLDRLISTPRLYGADWQLTVDTGAAAESGPFADVERVVAADPAVDSYTVGAQAPLALAGRSVPAVGLAPQRGAVGPTIVEGRGLEDDDEIVLGTATMRALGLSVGDDVEAGTGATATTLHVVGRAVFPRFAAYSGADKTGLGDGAAVTLPALEAIVPGSYESLLLVDLEPGSDLDAVITRLRQQVVPLFDEDSDPPKVSVPDRPDDILGYEGVNRTPLVLAGVLVLLAGGTTVHALVSVVRRRRRDLAMLKALGFVRRQVAAAVASQATTIAVLALVVGIPLGVALGRALWTLLAQRIGAVASPSVPTAGLLVMVPLVLLVANAVAALPARRAASTQPAIVLRAE
jgi:ABC-type antimicrobial peptide transport system permease subunit